MAIAERCLMTWDENKARWTKMHRGVTYRVTCSELGVPPNKTASYRAANEWWRARHAAIVPEEPQHPHAGRIQELKRRVDWAKSKGQRDLARGLQDHLETLQDDRDGDLIGFGGESDASFHVWRERLSEPIPSPEKTLQALSTRFLALSAGRVAAAELSASEHDLACRCVGHFVDWIGPGNEPSVIDVDRWEAYFVHLRGMVTEGKRSKEYAKKDFRYGKVFIEWMASMDKMAAPKNLHSRRYRFGESRAAIETFSADEVRRLVDGATGQLKLHLLLMLNCGFYQSDISDLRKDEVDLERGYITRQRSKTRHHGDKVPTVSYRLWACTLALLRQHVAESKDPALALTTREGKPWVAENVQNNRVKSRRDGIKSNYAHLVKRLKITKPLKVFRKTSASMFDGLTEFSRYAQFFLGHSGRSVADKHYVRPNQEQFDRAVDWLRQQYGF